MNPCNTFVTVLLMNFHTHVSRDFADYLRDESRRTGRAEAIAFPADEDEVRAALVEASMLRLPVTVQGARTGIAAGAVPEGGLILNLSRLNRVLGLRERGGVFFARLQPGVALTELRVMLAKREFDTAGWDAESMTALEALRAAPPQMVTADPTEATASIGGMVACNASGARSFRYGAVRAYVEALHAILADGTPLELRRGAQRARGRAFRLELGAGRTLEGRVPAYRMPAVKNAAGYFAADDMDLVDLFVGSEGTLGVFTEVELRLAPAPPVVWGLTAFLPSTGEVCKFVREVRGRGEGETRRGGDAESGSPCPRVPASLPIAAIEYFSGEALALLRAQQPDVPASPGGAVYVEVHAADEGDAAGALDKVVEAMKACGGDEESAWLADTPAELERLHAFRHAVPEAVNRLIGERKKREPGLTKLGTDMAVPDDALESALAMYERDLARLGLEYASFGHIGNNHVHVNILPRHAAEYETGKKLYRAWAERVCGMGGTISAEHGVGKLKTELLAIMYGKEGIRQMREVKRVFDPEARLGRGNLFGQEATPLS